MKRKVTFKPTSAISYLDLTEQDLIGVQFKSGSRAFVSKLDHGSYMCNGATNEYYDNLILGASIPELLNRVEEVKKIFTFDDTKSLYKWMSKEKID